MLICRDNLKRDIKTIYGNQQPVKLKIEISNNLNKNMGLKKQLKSILFISTAY